MARAIRKSITIPGLLASTVKKRCAELGYSIFTPYAVELVCYDLRSDANHEITLAIGRDMQAAQDAVDLFAEWESAFSKLLAEVDESSWFTRNDLREAARSCARGGRFFCAGASSVSLTRHNQFLLRQRDSSVPTVIVLRRRLLHYRGYWFGSFVNGCGRLILCDVERSCDLALAFRGHWRVSLVLKG
jgi:hypothetical protein